MSYNFLAYHQDQMLLLPPSMAEWVAEGSLARFVSDVVDEFDKDKQLGPIYRTYRADGWGHPAYHPCMMVKVLLYGYAVGVRSSRRLAQALEQDVAMRYLSANQQPDFRTIADFRREHLVALDGLFSSVLELCTEAGLVKLGRVALDGRKVAGNASLARNRTRASLAREVARILKEAEDTDRAEDARYGADRRGDELPEGLRTQAERLARLRAARDRLAKEEQVARRGQRELLKARSEEEERTGQKKRGRKPKRPDEVVDDEKKANTTDPESRIMRSRRGWVQGYNGQAMVDCTSQVIVAQDVTQDENDSQQLAPMLKKCQEQAGALPEQGLMDAGYWSEANAGLATPEMELFIATTNDRKEREQQQEEPPPRGRVPKGLSTRERMRRKLRTKRGRAIYKQRASSVEPVFGQMEGRGLNRFLLRGVEKVRGEWSLFCTTHNLLKLWRAGWTRTTRQRLVMA